MVSRYKQIKVDGRYVQLHRYVYEQAHGPIPAGMVVHHVNNDPHDNRLSNLVALTPAAHSRHHNDKHPRTKRCVVCAGEFEPHATKRARALTCSKPCFVSLMSTKRNSAKLTVTDCLAIRERRAAGERNADLAVAYGVSRPTISRVTHATAILRQFVGR